MDKLREEFEAWAERVMPYEVKSEDDRYTSNAVSWAFVAYQAASASRMERVRELEEALKLAEWGLRNLLMDDSDTATKERIRITSKARAVLSKEQQ